MKKHAKGRAALKIILLVLIVFIVFIIQNTNGMPNHIDRGRFFFLVPLVICIGITQSVATSTWLGLLAGMLWDCVSSELPGFHSIALLCFGCVSALIIEHLFRSNIVTAVAMCSVGSAFLLLYLLVFVFVAARCQRCGKSVFLGLSADNFPDRSNSAFVLLACFICIKKTSTKLNSLGYGRIYKR